MANEEADGILPAEGTKSVISMSRLLWAVSVVLLVIGIVIVWIGVNARLSDLQPWQPLIAAIVALIAASLAYRGAMAKVNLDRETAITDRRRKQQRSLIQLEVALQHMLAVMGNSNVKDRDDVLLLKVHVTSPIEVKEAWENVDLLPEPLAVLIGKLWREFDQLHAAFSLEKEVERRSFNPEGFFSMIDNLASNVRNTANECLREVHRARGYDLANTPDATTITDPSASQPGKAGTAGRSQSG